MKLPRRTSRTPGVACRGRSGSTARPGGHSRRPQEEGAAGAIWSSGIVGMKLGCSLPRASRALKLEQLLRKSRSSPINCGRKLEATPTSSRSSKSVLRPSMGRSWRSSHAGEDEKGYKPFLIHSSRGNNFPEQATGGEDDEEEGKEDSPSSYLPRRW